MAKSILVGIDGSERGLRALEWAARRAEREGERLTLLAAVDPDEASAAGADMLTAFSLAQRVLDEARAAATESHPDVAVETTVAQGKVVDCIVEAAADHDLVVLGTHHGTSGGVILGAARALRVSVSVRVPTVVVPCDWDPCTAAVDATCPAPRGACSGEPSVADDASEDRTEAEEAGTPLRTGGRGVQGAPGAPAVGDVPTGAEGLDTGGIIAAVATDDSSDRAIEFAVHEALRRNCPLTLVCAWGASTLMSRASSRARAHAASASGPDAQAASAGADKASAVGAQRQRELDERVRALRAAHPDLVVSGRAVEGSSPAHVLLTCSRSSELLVMGTHAHKALGRALFGSVTHAVLLNPNVPTVVVPRH